MATRKTPFVIRDGLRMMVARPQDPQKAIRIAKEAAAQNDVARLANLMDEVGIETYTIVGYLSADDRIILDESGKQIGAIEAGDSFLTIPPGAEVAS